MAHLLLEYENLGLNLEPIGTQATLADTHNPSTLKTVVGLWKTLDSYHSQK